MPDDLPRPLRKQREVLYLPVRGHSAVLGTAGSGKTTLALYRAAFLSAPEMPHSGPTLLLTFNRALVTYLNHLKPRELRNVRIETYHKFARGYLNHRGKMGFSSICDPDLKNTLIGAAVKTVAGRYGKSRFFDRPLNFFVDEIQWILSHGVTTEEDYIKVERVGRVGTKLARELRGIMFEILREYLDSREKHGKQYDWDDIAYHVRQELSVDTNQRMYRHIVIDEGQDFSPEMLRSLSCAIPEDGSLTFFGDVAQQIYGQRTSWRSAGLQILQTWEFEENYRNTKQIARLGLAISKMSYFSEIADMVEPTSPKADGPLPTVVQCADRHEQIQIAVKSASGASQTRRVALLFKNREQERRISSRLPETAVQLHRDMGSWQEGPGIFHGTYHSAKGLEFDLVILPFLDADNLPDPENVRAYGEEDALTHDGRLLYVAITRAKTEVILLHSSRITTLLPVDASLFRKIAP
ncbi:MAG: AAA family ATPase [Candidatus Thiosymbion ectosymbiont of Robbea hypermnestra]|nr:AAA family ATPase [Candidatus Thiosymbion ectosymbiont of Robbea hypermnestra]